LRRALPQVVNLPLDLAGGVFRLRATRAQPTRQPLRDDQPNCGRDEKWLDAHIDQAREGAERIVRVQRREYHVPRQRCLHGNLRGLQITDLADHDLVGVLPQNRAQRPGECVADIRLRVNLG